MNLDSKRSIRQCYAEFVIRYVPIGTEQSTQQFKREFNRQMHQLVRNPLTIAVATKKCLKELPKGHGIHPQVIPAFCTAQLDGAFDTKLGFDNASNLYSFVFLIQGENDFDARWNICTSAMGHTTITKPASEQVAQISIENQLILNLVMCSPIRDITVIAACCCFKELAILCFVTWNIVQERDYVGRQ